MKKRIAYVVKKYRINNGLTYSQLSRETSVNRSFLYSIERGERGISLGTLIRLSKSLGEDFLDEVVCVIKDHLYE